MYAKTILHTLGFCFSFFVASLSAQVPQLINYQGRITVGSVNFDGSGQFKFALVNMDGSTTYWSNDGTSIAGSEPTAAVTLTVTKGLYSVLLGDATRLNMSVVPATAFTNPDVRLRVWFNDGVNGFQLLVPDQRIAAVGYAMIAGTIHDGAITGKTTLATGSTLTAASGSIVDLSAATVTLPNGQINGTKLTGTPTTPGQSNTVVTLTGGGATSLDGTNGVLDGSTVFTLGRFVALNITGLGLKWVVLQAGTNSTDGVSFVRPANFNASTFAYVFAIIG